MSASRAPLLLLLLFILCFSSISLFKERACALTIIPNVPMYHAAMAYVMYVHVIQLCYYEFRVLKNEFLVTWRAIKFRAASERAQNQPTSCLLLPCGHPLIEAVFFRQDTNRILGNSCSAHVPSSVRSFSTATCRAAERDLHMYVRMVGT